MFAPCIMTVRINLVRNNVTCWERMCNNLQKIWTTALEENITTHWCCQWHNDVEWQEQDGEVIKIPGAMIILNCNTWIAPRRHGSAMWRAMSSRPWLGIWCNEGECHYFSQLPPVLQQNNLPGGIPSYGWKDENIWLKELWRRNRARSNQGTNNKYD